MKDDDNSVIEGLTQTEVADNYNRQTRPSARRIKGIRSLASKEEQELLGNQSGKLVQKRLLRRFLIGVAVGAFAILMTPIIFPVGIIGTVVAIPYILNALQNEKFKGKIGIALQRYIKADDYKEKLQAQIELDKSEYASTDDTKGRML